MGKINIWLYITYELSYIVLNVHSEPFDSFQTFWTLTYLKSDIYIHTHARTHAHTPSFLNTASQKPLVTIVYNPRVYYFFSHSLWEQVLISSNFSYNFYKYHINPIYGPYKYHIWLHIEFDLIKKLSILKSRICMWFYLTTYMIIYTHILNIN